MKFKWFILNGKAIGGYSCEDEFAGEEKETIGLLAYIHGCEPTDIKTEIKNEKRVTFPVH